MKSGLVKLSMAVACSLLIALPFGSMQAASLYKWVDADGNITYQDTPPPNNVEFEETTIEKPRAPLGGDSGQRIEEAALANPVSLYTVPVCDNCDLVRLLLERNSIPFAEKNVRNNLSFQSELEQKTGALTVPTLLIGDTILDGYSRSAITAALTEAGFPVGQTAEPASSAGAEAESSDTETSASQQ